MPHNTTILIKLIKCQNITMEHHDNPLNQPHQTSRYQYHNNNGSSRYQNTYQKNMQCANSLQHYNEPLMYSERVYLFKACIQRISLAFISLHLTSMSTTCWLAPFPKSCPMHSTAHITGCYHSRENSTLVNTSTLIRATIWSFHSWALLRGSSRHLTITPRLHWGKHREGYEFK